MKKIILTIIVILGITFVTNGQKIKIISGDLSFLKDEAEINAVFEYPEDMKYGKMTLKEYVEKKVKEKEKKSEGSGEVWREKFNNDKNRYNKKFITAFGKYAKSLYVIEDDSDIKYTMVVKTTFTEPGFQLGFHSKGSAIDIELTFFESNSKEKVLAVVKIIKAQGIAHPDFGERVGAAYYNAGRAIGKLLEKKYL